MIPPLDAFDALLLPHDPECNSHARGLENNCTCPGGIDRCVHNARVKELRAALTPPGDAAGLVEEARRFMDGRIAGSSPEMVRAINLIGMLSRALVAAGREVDGMREKLAAARDEIRELRRDVLLR